jgi:hypothetical protein
VTDTDVFKNEFLPNLKATTTNYARWRSMNPGEAAKWDTYANAVASAAPATPPTLASAFGKMLVAAGKTASVGEPAPPPPPPPDPPPPTSAKFGETTILPERDNGNGNLLVAQSAKLDNAGKLVSLSFYIDAVGGNLRLALYDATGPNGGPGRLLAQTAEFVPVAGWNEKAVTPTPSLPAGTYWPAYLPSSNALGFRKRSDASSSGRFYGYQYGAPPTVFSGTPASTPSHWSLYGTVEVVSVPPIPAAPGSRTAAGGMVLVFGDKP